SISHAVFTIHSKILVMPPGCANFTSTNPGTVSNRHATFAASKAADEDTSVRAVPSRRTAAGRGARMRRRTERGFEAMVTLVGPAPSTLLISVPSKTVNREAPAG